MTTPTGPKNITDAMLKAALRKHAGVYTLAAKELGCERSNVSQRVSRSEDLQAYCAMISAEIIDQADAIILDAMGERTSAGKPTKEARETARWMKRYHLQAKGLSLRVEATAAKDPAPGAAGAGLSVQVTVTYIDPTEDVI